MGGDHVHERAGETTVTFDREDPTPRVGQRDRERAEPGTDLEDGVAGTDACIRDDRASEVRIGQEVLTQPFRRPDPMPRGEILQRGAPEPLRTLTS